MKGQAETLRSDSVGGIPRPRRSFFAPAPFFISTAISLFLATAILPVPVSAAVPAKITYQGNIRQNGNLVTGQRSITFRIYNSSTSSSALWTSPVYPVFISTGVFKVDTTISHVPSTSRRTPGSNAPVGRQPQQ